MLFVFAVPKPKTDAEIVRYFWTVPIIDAAGGMVCSGTIVVAAIPQNLAEALG